MKNVMHNLFRFRKLGVLLLGFLTFEVLIFATTDRAPGILIKEGEPVQNALLSKRAFLKSYTVLMSARCMNCHPAGDIPLQGDHSTLHTMNVTRGVDGRGVLALRCANCHMQKNTPGLFMPPGNPQWRLPPENMRMVFQGRTPRQLAAQLKDQKRNGGKSLAALIEHVTNDTLVRGAWHPGQGRSLPPMTHEQFARTFKEWIDRGAFLPD